MKLEKLRLAIQVPQLPPERSPEMGIFKYPSLHKSSQVWLATV